MEDLKKDAEDNKIMGVLAYFNILFLVPYLAAKESPFARFHANQGCILFIAEIALSVLSFILLFIPYVGVLLAMLLSLGIFVLTVLGIVNAIKGEQKELPFIGKFKII